MLTVTLYLALLQHQQEAQRAAERMQMAQQIQQRPSSEQRDREAYWKVEDAYAKAQKGRMATKAELDRLVVKP